MNSNGTTFNAFVDGDYFIAYPFVALVAAMAVVGATLIAVYVANRWDRTGGELTLAVLIVIGTVTAAYASMIYNIQQNPLTEMLVGSLATALGAVMARWMGRIVDHHTS